MKKGAIYVRVSTDEQAKEGYSIEAQIKAIKDYACRNSIFIDSNYIFKDEGISGKRAEKRPAFMEMIRIAKSKPQKFDVILVHKFDRFSRNREDSIVYKSLLRKKCNIQVVSITEPVLDDKFGVILEAILEAMAEYYSLNLADEVKKGQLEKHRHGELQTRPCYGYDVLDNKLIINEKESKIIKYIFEQYVIKDIPMLTIARNLSAMNITNKKGRKFENRNLCYILHNPTYIGKLRYTPGERKMDDFDNSNVIIVDGSHEAIISTELWNLAQKKLENNHKGKRPRERNESNIKWWLKGLIRCSECNCTMVVINKKWIRCNGYNKGKCGNKNILLISEIEQLVIGKLREDLSCRKIENIVYKKLKCDEVSEQEILLASIKALSEKEIRIKEAYINGIDSLEEYQNNKKNIQNERIILNNKLNIISFSNDLEKEERVRENGKYVYEIFSDNKIDNFKKNNYAKQLFYKIEFKGKEDKLVLYYN